MILKASYHKFSFRLLSWNSLVRQRYAVKQSIDAASRFFFVTAATVDRKSQHERTVVLIIIGCTVDQLVAAPHI